MLIECCFPIFHLEFLKIKIYFTQSSYPVFLTSSEAQVKVTDNQKVLSARVFQHLSTILGSDFTPLKSLSWSVDIPAFPQCFTTPNGCRKAGLLLWVPPCSLPIALHRQASHHLPWQRLSSRPKFNYFTFLLLLPFA